MKKLCALLLSLMFVISCASALAEGEAAVTMELNKEKLPVFAADDSRLAGLLTVEEDPLQGVLDTEAPVAAQPEEVIVLRLKQSLKLKPIIGPKNLKNKKFTLSVSDEEAGIVKVKGDTITGTGLGETILTITSNADPSVKLDYRVLVIQPVKKIAVTASNKTVDIGKTVELTAEYTPEDASIKSVVWSSANEKIATVDGNGVVTGVKRGDVRIFATAVDGSGAKSYITLKVVQPAESITLSKSEISLYVGKRTTLKATVMPKNTDNKHVEWESTDESIAKVDSQGRITAVKRGTCDIICTSKSNEEASARATVNVLQPVKSIKADNAPVVYVDETGKITWTVEPADASNPAVSLKSSDERILKVDADGTITGVKAGEAYVTISALDGSGHRAKVKVKVMQHITGVKMRRKTAYINVNESETVSAVFEPSKYINTNMTWKISKPSVATIKPETRNPNRVKLTGVKEGTAKLTGITEDGGLVASMDVRIGNWNNVLKITDAYIDNNGFIKVIVQNNSEDLDITSITIKIEAFTSYGDPVEINSKDNSNVVEATYTHTVKPGESTPKGEWKLKDYNNQLGFKRMVIHVTKYQINNDWIKEIKENYQPSYNYKRTD